MKRLPQYFLQGLIIITPAALTLWVCWWVVSTVDSILPIGIPGAGILVTLVAITLVGALASSIVTRGMVSALDKLLERLPFVRLLYTSTKDLLGSDRRG